MKSMKCSDLGSEGCEFEATGETTEEVKGKMYKHAEEVHPDKMAKMSDEEKSGADKIMDEFLNAQEG